MKRYLRLLVVALAAAAALALVARWPRPKPVPPPAAAAVPTVTLEIVLGDSAVVPEAAAVPKDHRVLLTVTNRGAHAARLALAGYEDRLEIGVLAPGASWRGAFLTDRPGDDFTWMLEGRPAGRLRVTGSHLVEGHR